MGAVDEDEPTIPVVVHSGDKYPTCNACTAKGDGCQWDKGVIVARLSGNPLQQSACISCKNRRVSCRIDDELITHAREVLDIGGSKRKFPDDHEPSTACIDLVKKLKTMDTKMNKMAKDQTSVLSFVKDHVVKIFDDTQHIRDGQTQLGLKTETITHDLENLRTIYDDLVQALETGTQVRGQVKKQRRE